MPVIMPKKLDTENIKLKIGIYGPSNFGKSHAAYTFPDALVANVEGGADALGARPEFRDVRKFDLNPQQTPEQNMRDVVDTMKAVYAGNADVACGTLVIDSITGLRNLLKSALKGKPENVGEWAKFNWDCQRAIDAIYGAAPCHVVAIAQEKKEFATPPGGRGPVPTGKLVPDADSRFTYAFDLLLRVYDGGDDRSGKRRMFIVEKSRLAAIPEGTVIEDFSFAKDVLPALKSGFSTTPDQIPANLTAPALKALWSKAGSPGGEVKAWITSQGFDSSALTLDERIKIDHVLQGIVNAAPAAEADEEFAAVG